MSHAVMPLADYVGACDVIREKTGGTEPITSGELVEQIGAVHTAGKLAALESAEVLKGNLFGNPVTATAVTPITHDTGARLESKNLFDVEAWARVELPCIQNGVTYEYEGNGVIHIYGTNAASGGTSRTKSLGIPCNRNTHYTASVEYLSGTTEVNIYAFFGVGENDSDADVIAGRIYNFINPRISPTTDTGATLSKTGVPINTLSTANYITAFWLYTSGSGVIDIRVRVWLEHSSTATPYTPYVSDFTKVRTKNLFEYVPGAHNSYEYVTLVEQLDNGVIMQGFYSESSVNIPSVWSAGWYSPAPSYVDFEIVKSYFPFVRAGDTVTLSLDYTVTEFHENRTGDEMIAFNMELFDEDGNRITKEFPYLNGVQKDVTVRITATHTMSTNCYVAFYVSLNSNTVRIENIQYEFGTEATPYVPYTIPAVVNKRGKNLIPYPYIDTTKTEGGITYTDNGDGTITVNGTRTGSTVFILRTIDLPRGTYTINPGTGIVGNGHEYFQLLYMKDGVEVDRYTTYSNWSPRTITTSTKDYDSVIVRIAIQDGSVNDNIVWRPQLEIGSVATEFEKGSPVITYPADAEGNLGEVPSISPTMILECPDVEGVNIVAHYLKDIDGAFEERLAELEAAIVEIA